jgi:hypothetical protein
MDPDYKNPVTEQANIGYAWQLSPKSVLESDFIWTLSLHENKTINIDQRVPVSSTCCALARPLDAAFSAAGLPRLNSVRVEKSIGRSNYKGWNLAYRQRAWKHFSLNANYTLSWANSYSGGGTSFRNYPRDARFPFQAAEYGPSTNDERHHMAISGTVNLPWGFEFSPILIAGSARPYTITSSRNTLNTGGGTAIGVIVNNSDPTNYFAYAGQDTSPSDPGPVAARNCYYFTSNCSFTPYNNLRGDPFFQMDVRLAKNFKFGEKYNLQLIAQAFNLTNRANYGNNFHNDIDSASSFGKPADFINPTSTYTPRSTWGEFGFRFSF